MLHTLIAVVGVFLISGPAFAQFDHLHCYKVDPTTRVVGAVDLASALPELPSQAGCRVNGPKLFCGPVDKTIIGSEPPAPGAPPGPETTSYLCYKARCPQVPGTFQASDQFGSYTLRSRKSFLLCAPAQVGSTTTSPPTTTTSTSPPTTTTTLQPCELSAPACGGTCPIGQVCVFESFGPGGSGCGCTTPPACAPTGGGSCGGSCPSACFCFTGGPTGCQCICA